jgi:hypothetical protein
MSRSTRQSRHLGIVALLAMLAWACSPAGGGSVGIGGPGDVSVTPVGFKVGFAGQTIIEVTDTSQTGTFTVTEGTVSNLYQVNFYNANGEIIVPGGSHFLSVLSMNDSIAFFVAEGGFAGRVHGEAQGVTSLVFRYMVSPTTARYVSPPVPALIVP